MEKIAYDIELEHKVALREITLLTEENDSLRKTLSAIARDLIRERGEVEEAMSEARDQVSARALHIRVMVLKNHTVTT